MSGRCRACNNKLNEIEMKRKVYGGMSHTVEYNDLCTHCANPQEAERFMEGEEEVDLLCEDDG